MEIGKDASEMLVSERNAVLRGPAKAEITGGTEKRTARRTVRRRAGPFQADSRRNRFPGN